MSELDQILLFPILYMPGILGNKLRYYYYKRKLKFLGKDAIIDVGVQLFNPQCISIGNNTHIDKFVILAAGKPYRGRRVFIEKTNSNYGGEPGELIIGDGVHVAPYVLINAHGGVSIGNNLGIASGAKIFSLSHHYRNTNIKQDKTLYKFGPYVSEEEQCLIIGPVVIKDSSALGVNSVVFPGSTIGKNSWVGVMCYVIGDIPDNVIAAAYPAKGIKKRI